MTVTDTNDASNTITGYVTGFDKNTNTMELRDDQGNSKTISTSNDILYIENQSFGYITNYELNSYTLIITTNNGGTITLTDDVNFLPPNTAIIIRYMNGEYIIDKTIYSDDTKSTISSHIITAINPDIGESYRCPDPSYGIINSADTLSDIRLDGNYCLGRDIDLSEIENFTPIGYDDNAPDTPEQFMGKLDGNNKNIINLKIDSTRKNVGIFSHIGSSGEVKDLTILDSHLFAQSHIGTIAGQNDGRIDNVKVEKLVAGFSDNGNTLGGLVGNNTGTIINSQVIDYEIESPRYILGGLVGNNEGGEILDSYANVDIMASVARLGGLVGYNNKGNIKNSYANGDVIARALVVDKEGNVGGLVGKKEGGTIENSHANGNVINGGDNLRRAGWNK